MEHSRLLKFIIPTNYTSKMDNQNSSRIEEDKQSTSKVEEVPGEQKLRGDVEDVSIDTYSLEPVIKVTKKEASWTKGDVKLQKITVTEDISVKYQHLFKKQELPGKTVGSKTKGSHTEVYTETVENITVEKNSEIWKETSSQEIEENSEDNLRTKIPISRLRQTVEKVKAERRKSKKERKNSESKKAKSGIPKPTKMKPDKQTDTPDDEFDKLYQEVVQDEQVKADDPIRTDEIIKADIKIDDVDNKFEELIHDYEENKLKPINVDRVKSKIPKRKSLPDGDLSVEVERRGKILAARDKVRLRKSVSRGEELRLDEKILSEVINSQENTVQSATMIESTESREFELNASSNKIVNTIKDDLKISKVSSDFSTQFTSNAVENQTTVKREVNIDTGGKTVIYNKEISDDSSDSILNTVSNISVNHTTIKKETKTNAKEQIITKTTRETVTVTENTDEILSKEMESKEMTQSNNENAEIGLSFSENHKNSDTSITSENIKIITKSDEMTSTNVESTEKGISFNGKQITKDTVRDVAIQESSTKNIIDAHFTKETRNMTQVDENNELYTKVKEKMADDKEISDKSPTTETIIEKNDNTYSFGAAIRSGSWSPKLEEVISSDLAPSPASPQRKNDNSPRKYKEKHETPKELTREFNNYKYKTQISNSETQEQTENAKTITKLEITSRLSYDDPENSLEDELANKHKAHELKRAASRNEILERVLKENNITQTVKRVTEIENATLAKEENKTYEHLKSSSIVKDTDSKTLRKDYNNQIKSAEYVKEIKGLKETKNNEFHEIKVSESNLKTNEKTKTPDAGLKSDIVIIQNETGNVPKRLQERDSYSEYAASIKGKVGRLISQLDSKEAIENSSELNSKEIPKKKSILSKIAIFEQQEPPKSKIPKKLAKLNTNSNTEAKIHVHTPLIVDEIFKPFQGNIDSKTKDNIVETPNADVNEKLPDNSVVKQLKTTNVTEIKEQSDSKTPEVDASKHLLKLDENKAESSQMLDAPVIIPKFRPVKEILGEFEPKKAQSKDEIKNKAFEIPKFKPFNELLTNFGPKYEVIKREVSLNNMREDKENADDYVPKNVSCKVDRSNFKTESLHSSKVNTKVEITNQKNMVNSIEPVKNHRTNIEPTRDVTNPTVTEENDEVFKTELKEKDKIRFNDTLEAKINEKSNIYDRTIEKEAEEDNLKSKTVRAKSTADLELVSGKVKKIIHRIKSYDFLEVEKKEVNLNIKELPKKLSVLEKIALFERKTTSIQSQNVKSQTQAEKFKTTETAVTEKVTENPDKDLETKINELLKAKELGKVDVPGIELANGVKMPVIALGTALMDPRLIRYIIGAAIDLGYRAFDTGYIYGNEKEVGEGIKAKIDDGTVKREDLFIISKLWSTFHRTDLVEKACRASLSNMGLDYFDLYLIHNPMSFKEGNQPIPKIANVIQYSTYDYIDAWRGMEQVNRNGLAKSIGVSNFNSEQIQKILDKSSVKPVINQVECNPYLNQLKLHKFCSERNITLSCYGVLGSKGTPADYRGHGLIAIEDPLIQVLASGLGVTPAQLLIKFQLDSGRGVVVKSSSAAHLWDNLQCFQLKLTSVEIDALNALNKNKRTFTFVGMGDTHKNYPFNIPF